MTQKPLSIFWHTQNLSENIGNNDWFSDKEKSILEKLHFTKRRSDWRLGRFTAKEMIISFLQRQNVAVPNKEIEILADADGSPKVFIKNESASFSISISHSHNKAFCVLDPANGQIGCDLEYLEPRSENLINDYFTESEITFIRKNPSEQKNLTTNLIWSAKESVLKALKEGLRLDTRSVRIIIDSMNSEKDWQSYTAQVAKSDNYYGSWKKAGDFVFTLITNRKITSLQKL